MNQKKDQKSISDHAATLHNTMDNPKFRITPTQQMVAACTGGIITSLFMTPLDVVKIRLHSQQKKTSVNKCFLYCNGLMDHVCPCLSNGNATSSYTYWYSKPGKFNGTLDAFVKITRNEGVVSLWSGLAPTLVLALPTTVIYFVAYEQLRSRLKHISNSKKVDKTHQPFWVPLLAGSLARTWAVSLVSPLELIRTKMQSKRLTYLEMNRAIQDLISHYGITGLWKGLVPTLIRDVPFSAIYWVTYEEIKSRTNPTGSSFLYSFLAGSISGTLAAIVTNPFDVVKTLYQIDLVEKEMMTEPPGKGKTVMMTLKDIYRRNGISGLFSGIIPRLAKIAPACAIMVASFEYGKNYFYKRNTRLYMQYEEK